MNPSFIVLIPKKGTGSSLDEFRAISFIGSMYKIIAKVLAIRFSKTQSAFFWGRQITDSIAALNEVIHEAKKKKKKWAVSKVDFAKAYDSMNWKDVCKNKSFGGSWNKKIGNF